MKPTMGRIIWVYDLQTKEESPAIVRSVLEHIPGDGGEVKFLLDVTVFSYDNPNMLGNSCCTNGVATGPLEPDSNSKPYMRPHRLTWRWPPREP